MLRLTMFVRYSQRSHSFDLAAACIADAAALRCMTAATSPISLRCTLFFASIPTPRRRAVLHLQSARPLVRMHCLIASLYTLTELIQRTARVMMISLELKPQPPLACSRRVLLAHALR